uniref:hypothetical protein n=1 Tax=Bacillus velezensis TaxID=492670 RepID=UPI0011A0EB61
MTYGEMDGTGTKEGDRIELEGLCCVLKEKRERKEFWAMGWVKWNIGHRSVGGGVGRVEKVVVWMKDEEVVGRVDLRRRNEDFD